MYIADSGSRVLKVTVSTGIITTLAGNGTASYSGDGSQATSATLNGPSGVAIDSSGISIYRPQITVIDNLILLLCAGNVYIADQYNNRIRKVTVSTGIITTIAGTGSYGYSGDNGAATAATLFGPFSIAVDSSGTINTR